MNHDVEEEESMPSVEPLHEEGHVEKKEVMISMRALRIAGAVIVLLAVAYFAKGLFIAATVNGSPISRMEVIHQLEKAGGKSALETLITRKLIVNEVKKQGIKVTDEEIQVEIKKVEAQVQGAGQGLTLDAVLLQRGMTRDDLKTQIVLQKQVEKLLGDKVGVTDAEVDKYIADNKINLPKAEEVADRAQIKDQIKQQKISSQGQAYVESLRTSSSVSYFVKY